MAEGGRILLKLREPDVPAVPGDPAALLAAAAAAWEGIRQGFGSPDLVPLLAEIDAGLVQEVVDDLRDEQEDPAEVPHPLLCFGFDLPPEAELAVEDAVATLEALPEVEWAQPDGLAEACQGPANPGAVLQTYLNPAPVGIGVDAARPKPGGTGSPVLVGVVEPFPFDPTHRDLPAQLDSVTPGPPESGVAVTDLDHATGVLGLVAAADNAVDLIGVAPRCAVVFGSGQSPSGQIPQSELFLLMHRVGFQVGTGDVLNVSIAIRDPVTGGQFPLDALPLFRTAVRLLSFRGTTVVLGAGNGRVSASTGMCRGIDLDNPPAGGPPSHDSPAIVVGGIQPGVPLGTFTRETCSNFGSRVDCCAWASDVLTLAGILFDASGTPTRTTATVEGTSFAAAIVSGVVAVIQGIVRSAQRPALSPAEVKAILASDSFTSDPCPGQGVGRMPDLARIVPAL
ncbi:MAG TPA: S8 family serine peptidase [Thermoleophilaceae bacterium]